ncbi:hypothetical protein RND71_033063 [Anisodus tanguticus]|uniref:PB1 domain-containing protein n=1 Tax=Anisodus tanguticus TaxID=243964 RepID=A0AAE1R734_9SOLA|nr:hypothetical protein RND71_033063 [Anisodus tanguticus]
MENQKVKLMCSYGGKIQLRPHDHQLSYVGGDTKILTVDRNVKFSDMAAKLNSLCNCNAEICIKYQLPGEDLDALVSLIDDDDVEQMMVEYDRMQKASTKPARLRLFLFYPIRLPESPLNPDFLFGFDKDYNPNPSSTPTEDLLQLQFPGISTAAENSAKNDGISGVTVAIPKIISGDSCSSLVVKNHHTQGLRESHVNGGAYGGNAVQLVYGVPVMTGGYHTGFGQFSVVAAGGGQYMDQPVYNFVPATAMTSVMVPADQQHKMMVSTTDNTLSRKIKG